MDNCYENFRTVLTMHLCQVLSAEQIENVLQAVDMTMFDFDISKKQTDIIPISELPEVVKYFLASKAVSNVKKNTLNPLAISASLSAMLTSLIVLDHQRQDSVKAIRKYSGFESSAWRDIGNKATLFFRMSFHFDFIQLLGTFVSDPRGLQ